MDIDQVKQYLEELGITAPDFVIVAILELVNSKKECLEANYSESVIALLTSYIVSLMAVAQGARYVSSQSLPGGLSRSFRYTNINDLWKGQINLLKMLDTKGCLSDLIPKDPFKKKRSGMTTISGDCYHE